MRCHTLLFGVCLALCSGGCGKHDAQEDAAQLGASSGSQHEERQESTGRGGGVPSSKTDSAPKSTESLQEMTTGPWRWRVLSFETRDAYVHKPANPASPEITLKPRDPKHKVAVVRFRCKPIRGYTGQERKALSETSVGRAGLKIASAFGGDKILSTSCFSIGHPFHSPSGGKVINLSWCALLDAQKGTLNGITVPNEKKNEPNIYIVFGKDDEIEGTLVFPHTPDEQNPMLFFEPTLDGDIGTARITLKKDGSLLKADYGDLDAVRRWVPQAILPFGAKTGS